MRRKLLAVVILCFALLVVLTVVLTSRYREPRGAATGAAGSCGAEPAAGTPGDVFLEDAFWDTHDPAETPAQVIHRDVETFE